MTTADALDRGRESFGQQAWGDAYAQLSAVAHAERLGPEDLERLALVAELVGRNEDNADVWARAHQVCLRRGDPARAARCAFWLGMSLLNRGEMARASGWLARAQRVLDDAHLGCVEQGYLLLPVALQSMAAGDAATAYTTCGQADKIGGRVSEPDLMTLSRLGRGQVLIRLGEPAEALALLDEAMIAVEAREVSPIVAGIAYCAVIEVCQELFDLRRAQEWTGALSDWCAAQPDLVLFHGQCLMHRAEILRLCGVWPDAMDQAERACDWFSKPPGRRSARPSTNRLNCTGYAASSPRRRRCTARPTSGDPSRSRGGRRTTHSGAGYFPRTSRPCLPWMAFKGQAAAIHHETAESH